MTVDVAKAEIAMSGGAYQAFGIHIDTDDSATDTGLVSYQDSYVDLTGSGETDGGLSTGFTVSLDTLGDSSVNVGEMRFSLSDDWGVIVLGTDDSASDLVSSAPWTATGNGANSGAWTGFGYNGSIATAAGYSGDAAGIRYFTPSMNGFGIGVSYQPSSAAGNNSSVVGSDTEVHENVVSLGLEYNGDMDGVAIRVHGGVDHTMNYKQTISVSDAGTDDTYSRYQAGFSVAMGGFTVGAIYQGEDNNTSATAKVEDDNYALYAQYSTGPHTIGLEYGYSESDDTRTVGGDDIEDTAIALAYVNSLGGGVSWDAVLAVLDRDDSGDTSADQDMTVFQTGIGISF
jgi:hypothetical protein